MISATFTITEEEYVEVQQHYIRVASPQAVWVRYWTLFITGGGLIYILFTVRHIPSSDFPKLTFPIVLFLVFVFSPYLQRRALRKRFNLDAPGLTNMTVTLDDFGYRSEIVGRGKTELAWTGFTSYSETEHVMTMFIGSGAHFFPKRALAEAEFEAARYLIKSKLPELTRKLAKAQGR